MIPIGFDVRAAPTVVDPLWNEARRSRFLLRDDVVRPLAVDQQVWRSQFLASENLEWRGVLDHWSDLAAMCESARAKGVDGSLVSTVVVWDFLTSQERQRWASERLEPTQPAILGQEWQLLGFDVADSWLISGLSNCGYVDNEREEWRSRWSEKLNGFHLLADPLDAQIFAEATNRRVPEHAPFFVYGLLLSSSSDGGD